MSKYPLLHSGRPRKRPLSAPLFFCTLLFLFRFFSQSVKSMQQRQNRIGQNHSRTDITHDFLDLPPHAGFIAVDRAFSTGRFIFLKRTPCEALKSICQQCFTFAAQSALGMMLVPAIAPDHHFNGFRFPLHPFVFKLRAFGFHLANAELLH